MNLFNSIFTWIIKQRIGQIEFFINNPNEVQEDLFLKLLSKAKNTEWGKLYGYNSIKSVNEFKKRVPIQDYESIKKYITRIMQGEQNILWPSKISWFAKSSGTTSEKSKFIPVSKETFDDCHVKGAKDLMSIYCNNRPDTKIFSGKGLIMGGSLKPNEQSAGSQFGDVSAVMMQNMPFIAQFIRTPDLSIALLEDWEEKIDKMSQLTINDNVSNIVGVPTWTMVLIKKIFELSGAKNLLEIWPNLELYVHGGVSFTPYKEQFEKLIPSDKMQYLETYNASEGFFSIQDNTKANDMLLMLDYGIFYEFLPIEDIYEENPKTLQLNEVEINKNYALIISTNAGLWRYTIGDTIKFTSISPYKIQVTGRIKHFINAFGEEVIVDNAEKAVTIACQKSGADVNEFTVGPVYITGDEKGCHEWLIEFNAEPESLKEFTAYLDESLKEINSDYEAKRYKNLALTAPIVHNMAKGTFYNWLKSKGKLGGQHKVPRLANDRRYVDDLLTFCEPIKM